MERICPYLVRSDDPRTVVDGYDESHACRAEAGRPEPVTRDRQLEFCLVAEHETCDRYLAAMDVRGAEGTQETAPDAAIVGTRLVVMPDPPRSVIAAGFVTPRRRWGLVAGGLAVVGVAAVTAGVAGGLRGMADESSASPTPTQSVVPSSTATTSATSSPTATADATPVTTAAPSVAATAVPTSATSSSAPQQTYVVQPGDTLNSIALRFGTTVLALQQANGLGSSDVILVGQVLIIP